MLGASCVHARILWPTSNVEKDVIGESLMPPLGGHNFQQIACQQCLNLSLQVSSVRTSVSSGEVCTLPILAQSTMLGTFRFHMFHQVHAGPSGKCATPKRLPSPKERSVSWVVTAQRPTCPHLCNRLHAARTLPFPQFEDQVKCANIELVWARDLQRRGASPKTKGTLRRSPPKQGTGNFGQGEGTGTGWGAGNWRQQTGDRELEAANWGQGTWERGTRTWGQRTGGQGLGAGS